MLEDILQKIKAEQTARRDRIQSSLNNQQLPQIQNIQNNIINQRKSADSNIKQLQELNNNKYESKTPDMVNNLLNRNKVQPLQQNTNSINNLNNQLSQLNSLSQNSQSNTKVTGNQNIDSAVEQASKQYGIDKNLIYAVINQESGGNSKATSNKGASGIMQLMPATAKSLGVTDIYDIGQNINAGVKYLKQQLDTFGSIDKALAAYNAGPGNVKKYGGIPPFKETQNYVKKILSKYKG